MANEQNLIPNSERSPTELREQTRKGGINSGKARRRKADIRKALQNLLDDSYSVKTKDGQKELQGEEVIALSIMQTASNPKDKNWAKAVDLLIKLTGMDKSDTEKAKEKAETQLLKEKLKTIKAINTTVAADTREDDPLSASLIELAKSLESEGDKL